MSQQSENGTMDKVLSALKEPDRFVQDTLAAARAGVDQCVADATHFARTEPIKALAAAGAVGFAIRILPVTRIVNSLFHVALALLKPAVLVYGGAKVWQKMHAGGVTHDNGEQERSDDDAGNSPSGGAGSGN
jgi:uncharacterized membrane protein